MRLKVLVPMVGAGMLGLAVYHVVTAEPRREHLDPLSGPPESQFESRIAGTGLIESRTENIEVGSPLPGVVVAVPVEVGQKVKAGQELFRQDDRELQADLLVRQAELTAAQAELARLKNEPRPEEVPVRRAAVEEAKAILADREDQYNRSAKLVRSGAVGEESFIGAKQGYFSAKAAVARAEAELKLLLAGAWEYQIASAEAAVLQAQARVDKVRTDLDRLIVRAPVDGEVLQRNVRPGEFVGAPPGEALILLGNVQTLHVRAEIDENDIPRYTPGSPGVAIPRGSAEKKYPLKFVRVEKFVVPKRSLTGGSTERVDTRVLQVIYEVVGAEGLYVGQQVDVFFGAGPQPSETAGPATLASAAD